MLRILNPEDVKIPLTVPVEQKSKYKESFLLATQKTGRLFVFAADQKIEHMNDDFVIPKIPKENADPEFLFKVASKARIGAFATHLGLITRYGSDYRSIPYVVKLNGKTNLFSVSLDDPLSLAHASVDDVVSISIQEKLNIVGVGYTVYLGSKYENQMIVEASKIIRQAHANGVLAILWMYPRGKSVEHERLAEIIAGAAGVGASLGADFVKVNSPDACVGLNCAESLKIATIAAGRTGVICSGGALKNDKEFLQELYHQLHVGNTVGAAVGRNIFQRPYDKAVNFCEAIASLVIDDADVQVALDLL